MRLSLSLSAVSNPAAQRALAATTAQIDNCGKLENFAFGHFDPKLIRTDPERTPNDSRTNPEQTPSDPKMEMNLHRNILNIASRLQRPQVIVVMKATFWGNAGLHLEDDMASIRFCFKMLRCKVSRIPRTSVQTLGLRGIRNFS